MGHFKNLTIATALAGLLGATGFAGPAAAQESDPSLLALGVGWYDFNLGDDEAADFLEFRSQAELSYIFDDKARLGVAVSHLSNAGIGDRNPGTEVLSLYYMVPLHSLTGN